MAGQFTVEKKRKSRTSRSYRKKSGVFATPSGFTPSGGGSTRASIMKAAVVFRDQARKNASAFSRRIPAATDVEAYSEQQAQVVTDGNAAPNAAPFEFGERHPLNYPTQVKTLNRHGRARNWRKQPTRPYMNRAATNKKTIENAAEIYAAAETALLEEEFGYTE